MPSRADNRAEVAALLELLDDPDQPVAEAARSRLVDLGPAVAPRLRLEAAEAKGPRRHVLRHVLHRINFAALERRWRRFLIAEEVSLEKGAFLLSSYRFPEVDTSHYAALLDEWATVARERIFNATGVRRAFVLSDFMFGELGFGGNERRYYDPNNSYLTWVIDHRTGIPVSLSVVYLLLAGRLGIPVFGVNMPAHFLVKYDDGETEVFLDVFNAGTPFLKEDGLKFLEKAGIQPESRYFDRASSRSILLRMLRNLLAIAYDADQQRMVAELERLMAPWEFIEH